MTTTRRSFFSRLLGIGAAAAVAKALPEANSETLHPGYWNEAAGRFIGHEERLLRMRAKLIEHIVNPPLLVPVCTRDERFVERIEAGPWMRDFFASPHGKVNKRPAFEFVRNVTPEDIAASP